MVQSWSDADEVSVSFYHSKEWWYSEANRVGDLSRPVPIQRIRQGKVRDGSKIDTLEAVSVLLRRSNALAPPPCYRFPPGAAKKEEGAPGGFPALGTLRGSRFSIARDRVGSIMRTLWKTLKLGGTPYILRGSVESIWEEAGVSSSRIVERSRHKIETYYQHYKRRVSDRLVAAIAARGPGLASVRMEEIIRL